MLGPTQMLKIFTHSSPQILLNENGATAAQNIVLEVFPTNSDVKPFFSLGIVSLGVCDIGHAGGGLPVYCYELEYLPGAGRGGEVMGQESSPWGPSVSR